MTAIFLTLVAFIVRYVVMLKQGTAWFDESFSMHFAAMPLFDMLRLLAQDVHPPLHAILLNGWMRLFGAGIVSARCMSVVFGTLAVPAMMRLAGRYGRGAALLAGGVTAFSPILLFHSADARMYPLLLLLVALATDAFLEAMDGDRNAVIRWGAFIGLALFTHLTAFLPFAIMLMFGWRVIAGRWRFLTVAFFSALPAMCWVGFFTLRRIGFGGGEWQLAMPARGGSAIIRFLDLFAYAAVPWIRALLLPVLVVLLVSAVLTFRRHQKTMLTVEDASTPKTRFLLVSALLPFLIFLPIHIETTKYLFIAFPALVTLVALGAIRIFGSARASRVLLVYLLVVALPIALLMTERRIRWDDAMAFIGQEEQPGDVIYVEWFASELSVDAYYHGGSRVFSAYSYEPELSLDERLVRHAGQIRITDEVIEEMAVAVSNAPQVFLVTGAVDLSNQKIPRWYFEHGWFLESQYGSNTFSPIVLKLVNPDR